MAWQGSRSHNGEACWSPSCGGIKGLPPVATLVLNGAPVRIESTGGEVSVHSVEQEALGHEGKDKPWGLGAHSTKFRD